MKTIAEPIKHIASLWSTITDRVGVSFRPMRYVVRVDYEDQVLLHNVVTGQLVVLDQDETEMMDTLPALYSSIMAPLIEGHYLVPEGFDEHSQVKTMRTVLRMLNEAQTKEEITQYTILPTTACNARCYYCFEHGVRTSTMSEQTAVEVAQFIITHCGSGKKVSITWFGGEPTLAINRIEQICMELSKAGVEYTSRITTNGYLFDEPTVLRSKAIWHLESVNIAMDGTEERYNQIKSFVNPKDDPYQRVMRNIGLFLKNGIRVDLRMNFDMNNYMDFANLIKDAIKLFGKSPLLNMSAHQINSADNTIIAPELHGSEEWFAEKIVELNDLARKENLYRKRNYLPSLVSYGCKAASKSTVTITPEGNLVRCPEQFGEDQITGNVKDGITNKALVESWKQLTDYPRCINCVMYPRCLKITNCSIDERCCYMVEFIRLCKEAIIKQFVIYKNNN